MARHAVACGHQVTMVCGGDERSGLDLPEVGRGVRRGEIDGIEVIQFALPYSNRMGLVRRAWVFLKFAVRSAWLAMSLDYDCCSRPPLR